MSVSDLVPAVVFEPFLQGILSADPKARVLFIQARFTEALQQWPPENVTCLQPFKPYAEALERSGFPVLPDLEERALYDLALVLVPKNMKEAEYVLAQGWSHLAEGGMLVCAADNKGGGTRLVKMLETLGLQGVLALSRHKARCAWGVKSGPSSVADLWLEAGGMQSAANGLFVSQPGLFSWDALDTGSRILSGFLPPNLSGSGADFGCGYGVLSRAVLALPGVTKLVCIDADRRALACCRENMGGDVRADFIWADLTAPAPPVQKLDFIVMNPPFHEGKREAASIGQRFIQSAARALKPGGHLIMVANTHLPYERDIESLFTRVQKLHQESGFKILSAVR
jgi:16S rRNA (guanine1207-N2)-methyltransferase